MRRRPTLWRRLSTAAVWPFGIALTSWHYMWRTTPFDRRQMTGSLQKDAPRALPSGVSRDDLQPFEDGVGPLFHRRYRVTIRGATVSAGELMALLSADPNYAVPSEFARFTKTSGDDGGMAPGDEYLVRMPGPWNGPVRVAEATLTSFRVATLAGHLEAGQVELSAREEEGLVVSIESWARSGDQLSRLLHQNLRMAKEVQLHWGWNYRTLKGHLEMGPIDYMVWKWLDSGDVEFRISAFSRLAGIPNPLVRLGFRLFGRREQVKFARHACDRMAQLTAAALEKSES